MEWLAQIGLEKFAGLLPGPLVFRVGEVMGGLAWRFLKARRQIVLRNLRIACYGTHTLPEIQELTRQTFRRTGANLLSALHSTRLTKNEVTRIVSVDNSQVIDALTELSPGVVIMLSHMGNWEILTRISRILPAGHANGAFYRPLNNPILNDRVVAQREAKGTRLFSKNESFHQATRFLRDGGILGILADQRVGPREELMPFFGRLIHVSPLPSLLARRSKSQIVAAALITDAPGRWRFRYFPVNGPVSVASTMKAIESAMKSSPIDVFWLQERWRVDVRPHRTIRRWLGHDDSNRGTTPHRAVLWLAGAPADWQMSEEWLHPDVVYEVVLAEGQETPGWVPIGAAVHRAPATGNVAVMQRAIAAVDLSHPLPIDYILTANFDIGTPMDIAARREDINLVSINHR